MYNSSKKISNRIFGVLSFMLLGTLLMGQQIFNPFPCRTQEDVPVACKGEYYELTFEVENGFTASDWEVVPDDFLELSMNASTGTLSGDIDDDASIVEGTYDFQVRADLSDGITTTTVTRDFEMFVSTAATCSFVVGEPCLREIAFVLDRSGSMGDPESPGGDSKWEVLDDALDNYRPTIEAAADLDPLDEYAVILFAELDANVLAPSQSITVNFPDLSTQTPLGGTPMGGGIQQAFRSVFTGLGQPGQGKKRIIVLLTDGEQNLSPRAQLDRRVIDDGFPAGGILGTGTGVGALPLNLNTSPQNTVEIYTIGIGTSIDPGPAHDILNAISTSWGSTRDMAFSIDEFMEETIPDALGVTTPRILDIRKGSYSANNDFQSESFLVNDSIQSLMIKITSLGQDFIEPQTQLYQNGQGVDIAPFFTSDNMVLYDINFPADNIGLVDPNSPLGNWEIQFRNNVDFQYQVTGIVDETFIHHDIDLLGNDKFYAGDEIPVRVKIWDRGMPVTENVTVTALILRPGDDIGDLAANTDVDQNNFNLNEPQQTIGQAKFSYLGTLSSFWDALEQQTRQITLSHTQNGEYVGVFDGTEVTGAYKIIAKIEGTHPTLGQFEGREAITTFVDFARPDDIDPNIQIVRISSGDLDKYRITMRPENQFNRKLGPAQTSRITVLVDDDPVVLEDQLDGTYEGVFSVQPDENPLVNVYVINPDTPVVQKPLYSFLSSFGLSVHAGSLRSLDDAAPLTTSSTGTYIEVDLSYKFSPKWGLQLVGGQYNYDNPDLSFVGGHLLAEYSFLNPSGSGLFVNGALGLGALKPDNQDLELSIGAKALVGYRVGSNLEAGLDLGAYWLPTPGYRLGLVGGSLRYFF